MNWPGVVGADSQSPGDAPATTCAWRTTSATVLAVTPWVDSSIQRGSTLRPTEPVVGLRPTSPHSAAGIRTLPPPSEVVAIGTNPAASAAADPPLEPPGEQSVFHGLRVAPKTRLAVNGAWPNAGVLVRPRTIAPAARSRATASSSLSSGSASTNIADP